MNRFDYYFEFAKNAPSRTEIVDIENFFREKKLYFIFTVNSVNKLFGRASSGLKYDVGGGYDYSHNEARFIFCGYRGPKIEILKEEIKVLEFKEDSKKLFNWLKEKKYIFCLPYQVNIQGPYEDNSFNLAFRNDNEDNHQLSLYELDLLLTKIFKIYLVDDAFKISNNFKTQFVGTDMARNILYKKFLAKYLANFPGKPYRLYQNVEKEWDDEDNLKTVEKSKNILRVKNSKVREKITKAGFVIVPKKLYLNKILQKENVSKFVDTMVKLEKLTDVNCRKIYIDFLNDKINEKEMEDLFDEKLEDGILDIEEIIEYALKAKEYKKEIEVILNKQRKKIPFNKFISKYVNLFNKENFRKQINNKILRPSKHKNLIEANEIVMRDILIVTDFIKDNNIKFKKMGEITLEKVNARIEEVKTIASEMKEELEQEITKLEKESKDKRDIEEKKKNDAVKIEKEKLNEIEQLRIERDKRDGKERRKRNPDYDDDPDLRPPPEIDDYTKRVEVIEKEIRRLQIVFSNFSHEEFNKNFPLRNRIRDKISDCNKVINACNYTLDNFFSEINMKKYGYNSLKNMITDIYRGNLFNSKQIKSFLFEMKIIKNNFEFYLFFN